MCVNGNNTGMIHIFLSHILRIYTYRLVFLFLE